MLAVLENGREVEEEEERGEAEEGGGDKSEAD